MPATLLSPFRHGGLGAKLGGLLAGVFLLSLGALWTVQWLQRRALEDLLALEGRERAAMLVQAIELTSRPLRDFTGDYAQWDDMVRFVSDPKKTWAAINLDVSVERFDLFGLWVLRPDGTLVYATRGEDTAPPSPLPVTAREVQELIRQPPERTFFIFEPDRLLELSLAPVQPSADVKHASPPLGWLLAAKQWDERHLQLLSSLLNCSLRVGPPGGPLPPPPPASLTQRQVLPGLAGRPAADLQFTVRAEELAVAGSYNFSSLLAFGAGWILSAVLVVGALYAWVLRPLSAIGDSLARNDATPVAPFTQRGDEMGRLARLVETAFAQRTALELNLADRARLGRELHDGAIQTIYATGMTLAGVRGTLRTHPATAEQAIDSVRSALNATIRDLRKFIDGLEAEGGRSPRLGEAMRSVLTLMQGIRPFAFAIEVDDAAAEDVGEEARLHLLQIVREAASNCARHSRATRLEVTLRRRDEAIVLQVTDNGGGLDTAAESKPGRGLSNLADRTRELGGALRLESAPGRGLELQVILPLTRSAPA
ncbi:MAG: hypothetical protein HZC55_06100 [Verrucomicrobia bacterium]|nr:hypothetical protein [Verrucomicrobiota bacterium]